MRKIREGYYYTSCWLTEVRLIIKITGIVNIKGEAKVYGILKDIFVALSKPKRRLRLDTFECEKCHKKFDSYIAHYNGKDYCKKCLITVVEGESDD